MVVPPDVPADSLGRLSSALWEERHLLDRLVDELGVEVACLRSDPLGHRLLPPGRSDTPERLRLLAIERAVWALEVGTALGVCPVAGLEEIAAAVPEPWSWILQSHLEELRRGLCRVQERLEQLGSLLGAAGRPASDLPAVGIAALAGMLG